MSNDAAPAAKTRWYKKWWGIVILTLIAVGVVGNMAGASADKEPTPTTVVEAAATTTAPEPTTTEAPTTTVAEKPTTTEAAPTTTIEVTPEVAFRRAVWAEAAGKTLDGIDLKNVLADDIDEFAEIWCDMLDTLGADATEEQTLIVREMAVGQRPAEDEAAVRLIMEAAEQHLCPMSERPASPTTTAVAEPELSVSQQNAIEQAESYISHSAFSRTGLIEQLEYEGYSTEESTYAVDHITVDWMEQAAKQAESYLSHSAFSRQGLIDQLLYEGYTEEQAIHGVDSVGL